MLVVHDYVRQGSCFYFLNVIALLRSYNFVRGKNALTDESNAIRQIILCENTICNRRSILLNFNLVVSVKCFSMTELSLLSYHLDLTCTSEKNVPVLSGRASTFTGYRLIPNNYCIERLFDKRFITKTL